MIDLGARCEAHTGEVYPPRCDDCAAAAREAASAPPVARQGAYLPGTHCPTHPFYPLPCDRCARDAQSA